MDKLLPCPFCGGEARLHDGLIIIPVIDECGAYIDADIEDTPAWVECAACGASTDGFDDADEAITAWSLRAQPENKPLTRCENCARWDKSITFMGAHACAHWSPSRKEPRYTEWFEFCSFAEAKHEMEEHHEAD